MAVEAATSPGAPTPEVITTEHECGLVPLHPAAVSAFVPVEHLVPDAIYKVAEALQAEGWEGEVSEVPAGYQLLSSEGLDGSGHRPIPRSSLNVD